MERAFYRTLIDHCYTVCPLIIHCYTVCPLINHCYTVPQVLWSLHSISAAPYADEARGTPRHEAVELRSGH
jgi:hypothetical protein